MSVFNNDMSIERKRSKNSFYKNSPKMGFFDEICYKLKRIEQKRKSFLSFLINFSLTKQTAIIKNNVKINSLRNHLKGKH